MTATFDLTDYGDMHFAAHAAKASGFTSVMIDPAHAIELIDRIAALEGAINAWADTFWAPADTAAGTIDAHNTSVDGLLAVVGREEPKRDGSGT